MENKTKTETFIGFAVRARAIKIGVNACATLKNAKLVIVCHTASDNTVRDALKLAKRFRCRIIKTVKKPLSDYVHRENAKVTAITDLKLSEAILGAVTDDFIELFEENQNG